MLLSTQNSIPITDVLTNYTTIFIGVISLLVGVVIKLIFDHIRTDGSNTRIGSGPIATVKNMDIELKEHIRESRESRREITSNLNNLAQQINRVRAELNEKIDEAKVFFTKQRSESDKQIMKIQEEVTLMAARVATMEEWLSPNKKGIQSWKNEDLVEHVKEMAIAVAAIAEEYKGMSASILSLVHSNDKTGESINNLVVFLQKSSEKDEIGTALSQLSDSIKKISP